MVSIQGVPWRAAAHFHVRASSILRTISARESAHSVSRGGTSLRCAYGHAVLQLGCRDSKIVRETHGKVPNAAAMHADREEPPGFAPAAVVADEVSAREDSPLAALCRGMRVRQPKSAADQPIEGYRSRWIVHSGRIHDAGRGRQLVRAPSALLDGPPTTGQILAACDGPRLVLLVAAPGPLRESLKAILYTLPCAEVLELSDPVRAIDLVREWSPALAVIDSAVCDAGCWRRLDEARGARPPTRYVFLADQVQELPAGPHNDLVVLKGFPAPRLVALVEALLARQPCQGSAARWPRPAAGSP